MDKKVSTAAAAGIFFELLYGAAVTLFLVTGAEAALTLWELMCVFGGVAFLVIITIIADGYRISELCRRFMTISLSGMLFLTSAAHFTSVGVTRVLAAQGMDVPDYMMIGKFPSYEMTLDYTAWGFFMGSAFLSMFFGIKDKIVKRFSLICAVLCLAGFIGSFFSDVLWYAAPFGYVAVFTALLICILKRKK